MKKVISGNILLEKMTEAVHLITDTVKSTLGPKGRNAIIDHSLFKPFITNDGVTIAENIESEDEIIQTILTLTKEASIKTNNEVGDGTTTTLVLLKSLFDSGITWIQKGINPIILKQELDKSLLEVKNMILKKSRKATKKELIRIANISANDKEIGKIISDAYFKATTSSAIQLLEQDKPNTYLVHKIGYKMQTKLASSYFLINEENITLENSYILIIQNSGEELEDFEPILNMVLKENCPLIIISEDYTEKFVQEILNFRYETGSIIYPLKTPEYGTKQQEILKDIACISQASIIKFPNEINFESLGTIKNIRLNSEETIFAYQKNDETEKRKQEILKQIKSSKNELDLEWNRKKYAMFQEGIVEIYIGAQTQTERREKKMRFEDALCAIDSASQGIIPGSGITLLEISQQIKNREMGFQILANALEAPFFCILENAGLDSEMIYKEIQKSNFQYLFNVLEENYEPIENTQVLDATKVIIEALNNAVSIASMLLTTNHLIINEYQNEMNKINDYSEL